MSFVFVEREFRTDKKSMAMLCLWSLLKEKGPPCLWLQNVYGSINSLVSLVFLVFGLTGDVKP